MERGLLINCCLGGTAAGSGRSVLQKSPSRESWLHSGCFPMKGLPSNPQAWVSFGLLPQTPSFRLEAILRTGHGFPEDRGCFFIDWPVKGHLADWLPRNGPGGQGWD